METKENLNKGITLVALVITIIILLILAGVAITTLTQTGLFENAKQAKNAMENAQNEENTILSDYSSEINKYISSNRNDKENSQSLINKDDGIYNKSEGGYIFNTSQNNITYTSNNIITLSESIENYNYIEFECDNNYSTEGYSYPFSQRYSVSQIKEHYSNTNEFVYKNVDPSNTPISVFSAPTSIISILSCNSFLSNIRFLSASVSGTIPSISSPAFLNIFVNCLI